MAKDPAFLFYPGDWLGGTMLLTRHQKGCYMDLLMAQFNGGPLSLDQIKLVLGQDQAVWTVLQDKFAKDNSGRFFNQKLATEVEKRKKFVDSRSNNKSGRKKSNDLSNDNHKILLMENGIEDGIEELKWWGKSIVEENDPDWQAMNGRSISQEELDHFISVAIRNKWRLTTQTEFRYALKGFKPLTNEPTKRTSGQTASIRGKNYG